VLAAQKANKVVAVDVNPHAVACTKRNAEYNGVAARIETRLGDLFDAIETDEEFDLILFNSPYLPIEEDERRDWIEKAWAGGKNGRTVIDRFINNVSRHLTKGGKILLVQSSLSNVEETLNRFSQHKLNATIVHEEKSLFEKITMIRARKYLI